MSAAVEALDAREEDDRVVGVGGLQIALSLWRTGLPAGAAVLVLATPLEPCPACANLRSLSPDERRVASLTSAGLSQSVIAERLDAPLANVRYWLAAARKKLGDASRAELIQAIGRASACCDPLAPAGTPGRAQSGRAVAS